MATVNKDFRVKNGLVVEGTTGTINGSDIITEDILTGGTQTNITVSYVDGAINFVAENGVADSTTDDLVEGTSNLYYTDTRVKNVIDTAIANGTQTNITVTYDDVTNTLSFTAENGVDDSTTDDLDEGTTNLYFTNQRAIDAVINGAVDTDDIEEGVNNLYFTAQRAIDAVVDGAVDTDDIEEGTVNLYFTDQRAIDAVINGAVDTDDIEEGTTNLYFTETRARDSLSAGNGITYTAATGEIAVDTDVIADRNYVDSVAAGLTWKQAVQLLSDADVPLTGNTSTLIIDGHAALDQADSGYRILLISEATPANNGIYVYTDNGTTYTLTRATDADTVDELKGASVFVLEGTTYANTGWVQSDHYLAAFADQDWVQFSGSGTYTAGTGIDINGNIISLDADTDIVPEGTTNLYFTDQRAIDAVVNGAVDTDDIEEGTTNLYFTDQRAVDALEAVTPNFVEIDVNSIATQIATSTVIEDGAIAETVAAFAHATYRSAKFLVKVAYGNHTEVSEVLVTLDTSNNIAITEYAIVSTNGPLASITAALGGTGDSEVHLIVDAVNSSSTVKVFGTLIV